MRCAATSVASSRSGIFDTRAKACCILRCRAKADKTRYLPLHLGTNALIHEYLEAAGHGTDDAGALFRPVRNNTAGKLDQAIRPMGFTSWCALTRPRSASRSAHMR
jgi:hypothetical protein